VQLAQQDAMLAQATGAGGGMHFWGGQGPGGGGIS
jgi:hypothetical protein